METERVREKEIGTVYIINVWFIDTIKPLKHIVSCGSTVVHILCLVCLLWPSKYTLHNVAGTLLVCWVCWDTVNKYINDWCVLPIIYSKDIQQRHMLCCNTAAMLVIALQQVATQPLLQQLRPARVYMQGASGELQWRATSLIYCWSELQWYALYLRDAIPFQGVLLGSIALQNTTDTVR